MPGGATQEVAAVESDEEAATVLVVDDDDAVRRVAAKALRRSGYQVLEATDGRDAVELMESGSAHTVDLLLTDVVMPGLNGRELSEALREADPDLPVLFMSAYTEDEVILQGVRVAEVNFLSKPFTLAELITAVERAMAREQA